MLKFAPPCRGQGAIIVFTEGMNATHGKARSK